MADVSVEFGATDTGLQKTLETIQQQMSSLQGEVDSGTLSFQEINQKMRELRQAEGIFTKLGGEVSEATKSAKEFENQIRLAEAVTKSNRTALEIYSEEVDKLGKLLDSGLISQKTYAAAIEKAEAALKAATPQTEEAKRANEELQAALKLAEQQTKAFAEEQKKAESITKSNRTALEIYSDEVDQLQKLLDSGLISQKTYAAAIEKAEAALKAATPQTEEAKRANEELEASLKLAEAETKALAEEQRKAEAITKANRSATEIYNQEIEELQKHLSGGRISMETFEKAVAKADAKLAAANPQIEELGKDIADAGNKSDKMGDQAEIGFGKLAAAVGVGQLAAKAFTAALDAGFAAVRNTIQGFTDALDLGGKLSELSAATGESAGNLLLLQRAFDNTGAGADKVGPALAKLQNNIFGAGEGSKEAAAAFGRMGLSMEELAGKTPTEQLALVASGITSIEDPAARAATAIDIFGKSGAELLPLLTNFSGEMTEASATVGSLAEIMDRRANVFDAVSDRFKIISEKVRDFAAGILDRALPAIDAITTALSRIDAAAIGQRIADAFLGGQDAMKGFQSAVDAISIGKVALAFELFWESLKLQAMQSGNAIYKNLSAGLQTAADAIVDLFGPSSGTFTLLIDSFAYAGKASGVKFAEGILALLPDVNEGFLKTLNLAALVMPGLAAPVAAAFQGANTALDTIRGSLGGMQADLEKQKETLGASFTNFSANAKKQLGEIPKEFEANLASANAEFFKTGEQAAVVKTLQDKVTEATAATTAEREKQTAQTEAELAARQALKDQQAAADAQAKADKTALIELETQINAAKAAGNTELAASLEKQLQQKKAGEEIAKLTEEYVKTLGVTKEEAGILATNFVNAKNAAAAVKVNASTVSTAKNEAAGAATAAKSFATWLDYIKGVDPSAPVKSLREKASDARKEIEAFGEYIGEDLKNKSFPDIAKKLGVKTIGLDGSEQVDAILAHIESKREGLIGLNPVDEKSGNASVEAIQAKIQQTLGATPQTLTLDASQSIEDIRGKLKENIDLAFATGEGSKILGTIERAVDAIKIAVEKIEPKLPVAALAA